MKQMEMTSEMTRYSWLQLLRKELGASEETTSLLDSLEEAWFTFDQLKQKVGKVRASTIISCEGRKLSDLL